MVKKSYAQVPVENMLTTLYQQLSIRNEVRRPLFLKFIFNFSLRGKKLGVYYARQFF
jgi:hypothetical protein